MQALHPRAPQLLPNVRYYSKSRPQPQPCLLHAPLTLSITKETELRDFLSSKGIDTEEVESLSGGCANYCWRIKNAHGERSIIKHAESHVRVTPEYKLPAQRLNYEHMALTTIPTLVPDDEAIQLPQVYQHFDQQHLMEIQDGGLRTLKQACIRNEELDVSVLGDRLGKWLALLHIATSKPGTRSVVLEMFENGMARRLARVSYSNLDGVFEAAGLDSQLAHRIDAKFGSRIESDYDCLCHGDFWPGNVVVEETEHNFNARTARLTVIDWELARVGSGVTDIGQFAAQVWLLDKFHGSRGLMESFLNAYLEANPLSLRDRIRVIVHFAVHISFYSAVENSIDGQAIREVVMIGHELLDAVDKFRLDKLKAGPLELLLAK